MKISDAQKLSADLLKNVMHPRLGAFIGLSEEVGELANEIMQIEIYKQESSTTKLSGEIADVLLSLIEICNHYDIDLEESFKKKIEDIKTRVPKWEASFGKSLALARRKYDE